MSDHESKPLRDTPRRGFIKQSMRASAMLGTAATALFAGTDPHSGGLGLNGAAAATETLKMAFIQWQPHTVPAAWSKGIEEVLKHAAGRSTTSCSTARTRSRCRSA